MKIRTASLTDTGGRSNNDDRVEFLCRDEKLWTFVGDGLGGYSGGRMASDAACTSIMAEEGSLLEREQLEQAVSRANEAVLRLQQQTGGQMKTTLTFLAIENGMARWAHVGDSRLYHFRDGSLLFQTRDQSVSQMAVMLGVITQEQIRTHEDRNQLLRALGAQSARPELSSVQPVEEGRDVFLLCTDGFWEYVLETEMEKTLAASRSPQQWLDAMEQILKSRIPENTDNYTAAALFC